jgi:hypothetical protein
MLLPREGLSETPEKVVACQEIMELQTVVAARLIAGVTEELRLLVVLVVQLTVRTAVRSKEGTVVLQPRAAAAEAAVGLVVVAAVGKPVTVLAVVAADQAI